MSDSTSFQFSHDKYFKKVSLDEFLSTIDSISSLLKNNEQDVSIEKKITTVEDNQTYNLRHMTFIPTDEDFWGREETHDYSLEELDEKLWNKCWELDCYINSDNGSVRLTVDREEGPKRLLFRGNHLNPDIKKKIMNKYHRIGLTYKLGDGQSLISKYNYEFGCLITGMPYGRRGLF